MQFSKTAMVKVLICCIFPDIELLEQESEHLHANRTEIWNAMIFAITPPYTSVT